MCHFIPGEVLAFGPIGSLNELGSDLPGVLSVRPLVTEIGDVPESPFSGIGAAVLRTDPGLELLGLSQLSARLAQDVMKGTAIVDLNHILPLSAAIETELDPLRLSAPAERLATSVRAFLRTTLGSGGPNSASGRALKVGILDSGLNAAFVPHRKITYLDYSSGGKLQLDTPLIDPIGHGTRVIKILDEVLPAEVELIVGRLPADPSQMTCLSVAYAVGDLVARTAPDVLNLSIAPRDNVFVCPSCRKRVSVPSFLPTFFSLVLRLAGRAANSTVTVMAAGNTGQVPNSRWLHEDLNTLLIAVAENRRGERARYSGAPEGPLADLFSASAFGGDDPDEPGAVGAFVDGTHGTSFAAPFLAAMALFAKQVLPQPFDGMPSQLGVRVQEFIDRASNVDRLRPRDPRG